MTTLGHNFEYPYPSRLVYLAGPITGKHYDDARYGWRQNFADELNPNIQALSPMRQEGHLEHVGVIDNDAVAAATGHVGADGSSNICGQLRSIVRKDLIDIANADMVVFNFLGSKVLSQGSLVELGIAAGMDKPIVVINDASDPVHSSCFVRELPDFTVHTLDEAVFVVNSMLTPGV